MFILYLRLVWTGPDSTSSAATVTDWRPERPLGTIASTLYTPANPSAATARTMVASTPPTKTRTAAAGEGGWSTGASAPVARPGVVGPRPVAYTRMPSPGAA